MGYYEANSVTSYEQIAHQNKLTYFEAGSDGWNAMSNIDPDLAQRVNREFLLKQIGQRKAFILTSNPYTAQSIADASGIGKSYAKEIRLLAENGYSIEDFGDYWRAYK
ncbi:TPA: hypothetical protein TUH95_002026 [Streptococcus equi subsp. zooepidemicus]|nr:hypothetical protein [Streptococcus equi subsp. zooepidemicus]